MKLFEFISSLFKKKERELVAQSNPQAMPKIMSIKELEIRELEPPKDSEIIDYYNPKQKETL